MVESTAPGLSAAWRVRRGFADSNLSLLVIANNARAKGNFPFRQPCTNRRRHCCIGGAQHPPNYLPTHKTSGHIGTEQSSQDTSRGETGVSRGRGLHRHRVMWSILFPALLVALPFGADAHG